MQHQKSLLLYGLFYPYIWLSLALGSTGCSWLKLDRESNCLNDKTACFKSDSSRPRVVAFTTQPPLDGNNSLSELAHIDVTFSEEIKDGEKASIYRFKPSGIHNFAITSVQRLSTYTYRLFVGGSLSNSGLIELDLAPLTDYNSNTMLTSPPVEFLGNVNIPIVSSVNHNGVSTAGGYSSVTLKFHHLYTADITNANSYSVRLTSGAIDCSAGSLITSGTNLAPGIANEVTANVPSASFASGMNRLVICISNANNPNAANSASHPIIRDDVAPILTYTPAGDSYASPKTIELNCSNNADKIAYTSAAQQGSAPADPAAPAFDANGNITTGSLYTGSLTAANPANPTYTKFLWRCIDIAGNLSAAPTVVTYYIDNTIPDVTVNLAGTFRQYVSTVNPSTTLEFTTDQVSKTYNVRRGGTTCSGGGDGVLLATGTTPATAGQAVSVPLNITTHFTTANTTYPLRTCVAGTGVLWGTAYLEITRDDTVPTITPTVASGSYAALQSVEFTCDDAFGSVHRVAYNTTEADGLTVPPAPANPAFDTATGAITSGVEQSSPLSPADRKTTRYAFSCIDRAGHVATVGSTQYTIDATLPVVTFVSLSRAAVSSNTGAFNDTTLTFTSNRAGLDYRIRRVADCDHTGTPTETIASGVVATAGAHVVVNLPDSAFPTAGTTYPLRACVYNFVGAASHYTASVNVTRDNGYPTYSGLTAIAAGSSAGEFTLSWPVATDATTSILEYRIYRSENVAGPFDTVAHVASAPATSITVTVPNPLTRYFYVAGAVDLAGNETKVTVSPLSTKPDVRLIVTGLGAGKSFTFADGTGATQLVNANHASPGVLFATSLALGQTYNFRINPHPDGQVCGMRNKAFGTLSGDLNVEIFCVDGVLVAGRFQDRPAAPLNPLPYRLSATAHATPYGNVNSLAFAQGNLYFGSDYDCDAGAPVAYCLYSVPVGSSTISSVLTNRTGIIRGIASDGVNLYFTQLAPENKLYKLFIGSSSAVEIATGFVNPFGVAIDYDYAYVADRGANAIIRVELASGAKTTLVGSLPSGPMAVALSTNDIYFTLDSRHAIYRAAKSGGAYTVLAGSETAAGFIDAAGSAARLDQPHDVFYDGYDALYFTEYGGHYVRYLKLSNSQITTLAGDGANGLYVNGSGFNTRIGLPVGIAGDGRRLFISLHGIDKRIVRLEESALVGYHPLTAATGLYDYAAQASSLNDATLHPATTPSYGADRHGGNTALLFTGSNYATAARLSEAGNTCSRAATAWFRATNPASGAAQVIFYHGDTSSSGFGVILASDGQITVLFGGRGSYGSGFIPAANAWTHVALQCRTGSIWELFVNGHLLWQGDGTALQQPKTDTISGLNIGANNSGSENLTGAISDVRLYTSSLAQAMVSELAQDAAEGLVGSSYNKRDTRLLARYDFSSTGIRNEGPATTSLTTAGSPVPDVGKDGDLDGARLVNGSDQYYFNTPAIQGLPGYHQPRTLCAWMKPTAQPGYATTFTAISYGLDASNYLALYYRNAAASSSNDFRVGLDYKNAGYFETAQILPINTWTHLCAAYDGGTVILYRDGVQIHSQTGTIPGPSGTNMAIAARIGTTYTNFFKGHLDDIRIYNRALTSFELRQLSVQVPVGLMARLDLDGALNDSSGLHGTATLSGGASLTADRFGKAMSAVVLDGTGELRLNNANYLPFGDKARTLCAWFRKDATGDHELMAYGGMGSGELSAILHKASGGITAHGNAADVGGTYEGIYGAWHHACVTHAPGTLTVYANGTQLNFGSYPWSTPTSGNTLFGGRAPDGTLWLVGALDDLRVYNRVLSAGELAVLVQQPNKQIRITATTHSGNLGGVSGADAKCSSEFGASYKAFLRGDTSGTSRRACTSSTCSAFGLIENIDWVLRPRITYVRGDATTVIASGNANGIFGFSLTNAFSGSSGYAWTGLSIDWTNGYFRCADVSGNAWQSTTGTASLSDLAATGDTAIGYHSFPGASACSSLYPLLCVEQ